MNTKWNTRIAAGFAAVMTMTTLALTAGPASASDLSDLFGGNNRGASSRQTDKNNMRNLGIGLGAAAAYEVLKGNTTAGVLLGAGAAYAGKKYEDERKAQAKDDRYDRYDRYDRGERREYRYRDGERVGYDLYRDGHKVSYYERQRDHDHWTDRYSKSRDY